MGNSMKHKLFWVEYNNGKIEKKYKIFKNVKDRDNFSKELVKKEHFVAFRTWACT